MQPQHSEKEERELGLPGSNIDHMAVLPQLYDVDTLHPLIDTARNDHNSQYYQF